MLTTILASLFSGLVGYMGTNTVFNLGQKREDRKKSYIDLSNFFSSMNFDHMDELFKSLAVDDYSTAFGEGKKILDIMRDPIKRKAHMLKIIQSVLVNNVDIREELADFITKKE